MKRTEMASLQFRSHLDKVWPEMHVLVALAGRHW